MKIRNSFVSNSSSVSFCICGICDDINSIKKLFGVDSIYDMGDGDNAGFKVACCPYSDYAYVGIDITNMGDDETKREFKKRVKERMDKIANKDVGNVSIFIDGWHDG